MDFLILESREGSGYADSATVYEFPKRYLKEFQSLDTEKVALIYEPKRNGGRQAFVAWALISGDPVETSPGTYTVALGTGVMSFDRPVPFAIDGSPVEHRLRSLEPKAYGAALQGKSVRRILPGNALEILALGMSRLQSDFLWPDRDFTVPQAAAGRQRDVVARLRRDAAFRDGVMLRWGFQCAVTGLSTGPNPASRLYGLIEAAHVQPVAMGGPDVVSNGLTLSPTVHRLFDAGLFTIRWEDRQLVVQTSPQLRPEMTASTRGSHLRIQDGAPLQTPMSVLGEVGQEFIRFHQQRVFRKSA